MAVPETPAQQTVAFGRPQGPDALLLVVALLAVSTSGPLIAGITAPALAIAFWRNAMAVAVLVPYSSARKSIRLELRRLTRPEIKLSLAAGLLLALHFATWVPSLTFTSVASATALVASQPVWSALIARAQGQHVPRQAWVGVAIAITGVVLLTGLDFSLSARALGGDLLAVVGGVFAAGYVAVGGQVRKTVSTTTYTTICYTTCAALLLPVCLLSRSALGGYDAGAWVGLVGLTIGAQLLGHSLFARILRATDPTFVSLMILFEVPGAALLASVFLHQTPPWRALPAAALLLAGVVVVVRSAARAVPVIE